MSIGHSIPFRYILCASALVAVMVVLGNSPVSSQLVGTTQWDCRIPVAFPQQCTFGGNVGVGVYPGPRGVAGSTEESVFPEGLGTVLRVFSDGLDNGGITVGGYRRDLVLYLYANSYLATLPSSSGPKHYGGIQVKRPFVAFDNLVLQEQGGNVGIGTTSPKEKLHVEGNLYVNGAITKTGGGEYVAQSDPSDPTKEIVYATPIGNEVGTYLRGTAQLTNGQSVIKLPEHFGIVTSDIGLTVLLTCLDECNGLRVVSKSTNTIVVKELQNGQHDARFDYFIQGFRKGFEDHQPMQEKE